MLFNEVSDIVHSDLVNSRTCPIKFKDFQAPALFSSTFKAWNLGKKIQVLSRTFKDAWEPCPTGWAWSAHATVSASQEQTLTGTGVRVFNTGAGWAW